MEITFVLTFFSNSFRHHREIFFQVTFPELHSLIVIDTYDKTPVKAKNGNALGATGTDITFFRVFYPNQSEQNPISSCERPWETFVTGVKNWGYMDEEWKAVQLILGIHRFLVLFQSLQEVEFILFEALQCTFFMLDLHVWLQKCNKCYKIVSM